MNNIAIALDALYNRIPRRHTAENVKEINVLIGEFEEILLDIERINPFYEKNSAALFNELENVRLSIKKSNDNKASKKTKDMLFDEGSGFLKDCVESLKTLYGDGTRFS